MISRSGTNADAAVIELSGGMKRRVMIAKALSHEPDILFLDEPTAGVDVELRRDMWDLVRRLRERGVTIILTTHYIEEAEEMADRVGVIDRRAPRVGREDRCADAQARQTAAEHHMQKPIEAIPPALAEWPFGWRRRASAWSTGSTQRAGHRYARLLRELGAAGIDYKDLETSRSSLEDIFVESGGGPGVNGMQSSLDAGRSTAPRWRVRGGRYGRAWRPP